MSRALVGLAVLALAGCEVNLNTEGIVSRETKRFEVTGTPEVVLDTFDGSIEIRSWDRDEVEVEIEKRAMEQRLLEDMTVSAEQDGNRIAVKVTGPRDAEDFGGIRIGINISPSARLRVAVPQQSHVTASSGDGSLTIEGVTGTLRLTTDDGSIRGSRLAGELYARTRDGAIRLDDVDGALDLETDDGSIVLSARPTTLRAHTGDGSIRLEVLSGSEMAGDWDLQTGDGSVVLTLPADFDGILDAESRDGRVVANHPRISTEADNGRRTDRGTLQTTLGAGGHTLRVRTGDGSIRIE